MSKNNEVAKIIRLWNYNAQNHILNVHYTDNSQKRCKVHPIKMKPIYQASKQNADVRAMVAEIAAVHPHESHRARPQLTAEEERFCELSFLKKTCVLDIEQEREYDELLNRVIITPPDFD